MLQVMVRPSDLMMYTYIVYNPLFYSLTKCASSSLHYRNIILDQWGDFKSDASLQSILLLQLESDFMLPWCKNI